MKRFMNMQLSNNINTIKINSGKKRPLTGSCDSDLSDVRFI